ncbi:MAG: ABC transporter permease [Candidatus Heimdallarchaeota archaeon]|nr:ABC transporter permease [Candidatus Heimdallarchaeota archaeon]
MNKLDDYIGTEKKQTFLEKLLAGFSFNLRLIWKNISNRKKSMMIITIGLVFSLSILFTSSIWTQTSQLIIADDYIETLDYEMYVSTYLTNAMDSVYAYTVGDYLVKQVDWYYPTVALFNFEDKGPYYRWYPENQQENMSNPVSLTSAHLISSRAIDRIKLNLEIDGNASLNSGEILISYTQAKQLEVIYNKTISPGDEINVAISRRIPNTDIGENQMRFYDINETIFSNYTITGIYKYVGYNTAIAKLLGGLENTGGMLLDSIFFPLEDLSGIDRFIIDSNGLLPRLLVKTNAQQLRINGISQMPDTLHALSERIKIRFFHAYCYILSQEIQSMANEYARTFSSTVLFTPAIVATIFLTILASQMTVKKRKEEITFLRSKGAVSIQIIAIFFGEFILVSTLSLILSIGTGILMAALIPALGHEGFFSKSLFTRYFEYLTISPYDIEIYSVLVLGIYLGMTLINVISFVRKDIHESMIITVRGQRLLGMWIKLAAFALTLAGFIFLMVDYTRVARSSYSFGYGSIGASSNALLAFIAVLFFLSYFVSIGINYVLRAIKKTYKFVFGQNSFLIYKNIKRQTKSLQDLTFFLILIICLLTTFVTIRSTTIHNNIIEDAYRRGSDIRIQSLVAVNITEFEEKLGGIEGIDEIMGFQSIKAIVGSLNVDVFGVDPSKFLSIGRWTDNSFSDIDPESALTTLEESPSSIILSDYIVDRLEFTIGENMTVTDFRGGPFTKEFNVSAMIKSAPGLGIAHGFDPKMNRENYEWVLLKEDILINDLGVHNGTLFLATAEEGADLNLIKEEIETLYPLMTVNPQQINPDYIGYFIVKYIPHVTITLLMGAIVLNVVGVVYILISTDFILGQRRRENAVILALGGNQGKIRKMLVGEISVFLISTLLIGIPLGFLSSILALTFLKPLLIPHEVITMTLHIDFGLLAIMIVTLCVAALLGAIPIIRKQMKYEIVQELRAIV